jgi:parvulin-like peptidyl-prolyl isomerase
MTDPILRSIQVSSTIFFVLCISACGNPVKVTPISHPTGSPTPTTIPTATHFPPAVTVNGEEISRAEFNAELARYQQTQVNLGNTVTLDAARQTVLNDMVDTLLLAQAASTYGFSVDDATVQGRIDELTSQVGGADALAAWELTNGYTDKEFRSALQRQILAAWMRDKVVASVPGTTEQVHVKQILLYNASDSQQVLGDLHAGTSFEDLSAQYDPVTKGDLGWFPRGYLADAAIADAAFALQPGKYSDVIHDETGYHILYLVERDPARQLSPDALLTLQTHALQDWLTQRHKESTILLAP